MFMVLSSWQSHCESSLGSFDERSGRRPKTKPDDLGRESACRLPETTPTIAIWSSIEVIALNAFQATFVLLLSISDG